MNSSLGDTIMIVTAEVLNKTLCMNRAKTAIDCETHAKLLLQRSMSAATTAAARCKPLLKAAVRKVKYYSLFARWSLATMH
jgi:hypothetical protein